MGLTHTGKEFSVREIGSGGTFEAKLSITAEPDIVTTPTDMVMVLDRSGSLAGSPMANLKSGAHKFIEIIDKNTDDLHDGHIGKGSRIGIVSFATEATADVPLTTSVTELDEAVYGLTSGGSTNHYDAFEKGMAMFDETSPNAKVMIVFTDGLTTVGDSPTALAEKAKKDGITIYCIGLCGAGGVCADDMNAWASDPDSAYVVLTPSDTELETVFENLAHNITKTGATGIEIHEKINDCFEILSVDAPTKGAAVRENATTVVWKIDKLGISASEGATLTFHIRHMGNCEGDTAVNEEITYHDNENNRADFPSPHVNVICDIEVIAETCPEPVNITVDGCTDAVEYDAGDLHITSLGQILQLNCLIRDVCPNKRMALAVLLSEVDANGTEHKRGVKTMVIPAHTRDGCEDVLVRCITFILPDELNVSSDNFCGGRRYRARFYANYIDSEFACFDCVL